MINFEQKKFLEENSSSGFTLVELLVVLSIFAILVVTIVVNGRQYDSTLVLNNAAYQVAFDIHQAQVEATGVKRGAGQSDYDSGYGLHFDSIPSLSYVRFLDVPSVPATAPAIGMVPNHLYDANSGKELIQQVSFLRRIQVDRICGVKGNSCRCSSGSGAPITQLDISFLRPDLSPVIKTDRPNTPEDSAVIFLSYVGDVSKKRKISVFSTGQITISEPGGLCE